MATRYLTRSLLAIASKQALSSSASRSYSASCAAAPRSILSLLRPLVAASSNFRRLAPAFSTARGLATRQTSSSLSDPNPNWSNRPPKETILLDGCDFEHWLVVMEKPEGEPTRDEIIASYINTLAKVLGSPEEARMKIYSVSTRHYYAFGALVSEELSYKLKELPGVRWVLPDSYLDVKNKDYGGEPFINGQAVPYDPKYHEEWVRNNARSNERNRRNDRPRNFDRSRSYERRRDVQNSGTNAGAASNMRGPPNNMGGSPNMGMQQPPMGGGMQQPPMGGGMQQPPNTMGVGMQQPPNTMGGGMQQPPNAMGGGMQGANMGGMQQPPHMQQQQPPPHMGGPPNYGSGVPSPPNYQYGNGPNGGGMQYQSGPGQSQNSYVPNAGTGPVHHQNNYVPNTGAGVGQNYGGNPPYTGSGNPYQNQQNVQGRDAPPPPPPNYQ